MVFEISVKGTERGIATIEGALEDRSVGIIEKIARLIKSVNIEIRNVGNACRFFKATG